jgi:hypothetical protein
MGRRGCKVNTTQNRGERGQLHYPRNSTTVLSTTASNCPVRFIILTPRHLALRHSVSYLDCCFTVSPPVQDSKSQPLSSSSSCPNVLQFCSSLDSLRLSWHGPRRVLHAKDRPPWGFKLIFSSSVYLSFVPKSLAPKRNYHAPGANQSGQLIARLPGD